MGYSMATSMDTDGALVARCRAGGDKDAFAELVRRYSERVFRLVVSILGPELRADAEEGTQEVFLRVHRGGRLSWRGAVELVDLSHPLQPGS